MNSLYLGLVHHPVVNKRGEMVTTSVTNLDIHDIARSCRTYGVLCYYIITPIAAQQSLVERILGHWRKHSSSLYNPDRQEALGGVSVISSLESGKRDIFCREGHMPHIAVTGANLKHGVVGSDILRKKIKTDGVPIFLLFGTGYGLHSSLIKGANYRLKPLAGDSKDGYNHLSVRSAVAIYLEKLRGEEHEFDRQCQKDPPKFQG